MFPTEDDLHSPDTRDRVLEDSDSTNSPLQDFVARIYSGVVERVTRPSVLLDFGVLEFFDSSLMVEDVAERPTEKFAEKSTEKAAEKPAEKAAEKAAEKPTEKLTEKPSERPSERPAEKGAEKPAAEDKPSEKPGTGSEAVFSSQASSFDAATTKALRDAGIENVFVKDQPEGRQIFVELNNAREFAAGGDSKLVFASKFSAKLERREDGGIEVSNIKGITATVSLPGGGKAELPIDKIAIRPGAEGKNQIEVTVKHNGTPKVVRIDLPAGATDKLERLARLLSATDRGQMSPQQEAELEKEGNKNGVSLKVLLALGVLTASAVGGRDVFSATVRPESAKPVEKPGVAAATGVIRVDSTVEFDGDKWKVRAVRGDGTAVIECERRESYAINPVSVTKAELDKDYREIQIDGQKLHRDNGGRIYEAEVVNGRVTLYRMHQYRHVSVTELGVTKEPAPKSPAADARAEAETRREAPPRVQRPGDRAELKQGDPVNYQGDNWKVQTVDKTNGLAVLHCANREGFPSDPEFVSEATLKDKYRPVQIGEQTFYQDVRGDIYSKTGINNSRGIGLLRVHEYAVVPIAQLADNPRPATAESFRAGDRLAEGVVVVAVDHAQQRVVIQDSSVRKNATPPFQIPAGELANYGKLSFGGKDYVFQKTSGRMFEATGDGRFKHTDYFAVTPEQAKAESEQERANELYKASTGDKLPLQEARRFEESKGTPKNVPDVHVETVGANLRRYYVGGAEVVLGNRNHGAWFYGPEFHNANGEVVRSSNVKVHVLALSSPELARLQAALIPELMKAAGPGGPLEGKVAVFKTHDPMICVEEGWASRMPWNADRRENPISAGPRGQDAKGFTIYAPDIESAKAVQLYVDNFLKNNGMRLEGTVNTGTVGDGTLIKDGSNRVTLEQDHWKPAQSQAREMGVKLCPTLNDAVTEYALRKAASWGYNDPAKIFSNPATRELSPEVLRRLQAEFHLDGETGKLEYAYENGRRTNQLMLVDPTAYEVGYLLEGKKDPVIQDGKLLEGVTSRGAIYHISDIVGAELKADLDPARLLARDQAPGTEVRMNGQAFKVVGETGKFLIIDKGAIVSGPPPFPVSMQDITTKYEVVRLIVDGKPVERLMEVGNPQNGVFDMRQVGSEVMLQQDTRHRFIRRDRASHLPAVRQAGVEVAPAELVRPSGQTAASPDVVRPVPRRPAAPVAEALRSVEFKYGENGTMTREEGRIGESMTVEKLKKQQEVSADQIKLIEEQAARLRKTGTPEDARQAALLERNLKAMRGDFGREAQAKVHSEILNECVRQAEAKQRAGGPGLGAAVGLGILLSAALGAYVSGEAAPVAPRRSPTYGGNR